MESDYLKVIYMEYYPDYPKVLSMESLLSFTIGTSHNIFMNSIKYPSNCSHRYYQGWLNLSVICILYLDLPRSVFRSWIG